MAPQLANHVKFIISCSQSFVYREVTFSYPLTDGGITAGGYMLTCACMAGNGRQGSSQDAGTHSLLSGLIAQATTALPKHSENTISSSPFA